MLQFDGASGLLIPGGPQTAKPNNFAVPDGLVSYWGMDIDCVDYGASNVLDLMPTGCSIGMSSNSNTVLVPSDGIVGGALNVLGSAWLDVAGSTPWTIGTGNFTVLMWIYFTSTATEQVLYDTVGIGGVGARSNAFVLLKQSTGTKLNVFSAGGFKGASGLDVTANVWNHIAFVRRGTAVGGCDYYINGRVDSNNHPTLATNLTVQKVCISRYGDGAPGYIKGKIDDVRTYLRALDGNEIEQLYQAGLAGRRNALNYLPIQMPVLSTPAIVPSLYQQSNLPVIGGGTY